VRSRTILITGGSGLLAINWACVARSSGWKVILGTHRRQVALRGAIARPIELDDPEFLRHRLAEIAPDLVVHTVGLTSVDDCEKNPALARRVNAEFARNVAEAAAQENIRLVHISTDHLFAGTRSVCSESDQPEPLNEYARSKLLAEEWVQQAHPEALILRTNFFGWGHAYRHSFSDWILSDLRAGRSTTLFDDVYFTPILADSLAIAAHRLLEKSASGIFNLVGDERFSKYQFGILLAKAFGLPAELIRRGRISDLKMLAKRPPDMSLNNSKARRILGEGPGRLETFFSILRRQEMEGRREELLHAVTE